jgi:hypothetical protein
LGFGIWRRDEPVKDPGELAHPQFLSKRTPLAIRVRKEKGGAHGVQAGKIRIIILRRLIIPWTGPVRGKFAGGDGSAQFYSWSYFPAGLSLRRRGRWFPRKYPPAEPVLPIFSSLNPNEHKKTGGGQAQERSCRKTGIFFRSPERAMKRVWNRENDSFLL